MVHSATVGKVKICVPKQKFSVQNARIENLTPRSSDLQIVVNFILGHPVSFYVRVAKSCFRRWRRRRPDLRLFLMRVYPCVYLSTSLSPEKTRGRLSDRDSARHRCGELVKSYKINPWGPIALDKCERVWTIARASKVVIDPPKSVHRRTQTQTPTCVDTYLLSHMIVRFLSVEPKSDRNPSLSLIPVDLETR